MAKKMGLGRGLSAILPDVEEVVESVDQASEGAAPVPADAVAEIPVGEIDPNRNQPRKRFDDDALLALAGSIRHNGVRSPSLVAREGGHYPNFVRRWIPLEEGYFAACQMETGADIVLMNQN